jgi:hypothetical protein
VNEPFCYVTSLASIAPGSFRAYLGALFGRGHRLPQPASQGNCQLAEARPPEGVLGVKGMMQQMRAHQGEAVAGEFDAGLQLPILPLAALLQVLVETVLQMLGTRRGFNTRIGEYQQAGDVLVLVGGVTQLFVIELTQVVPHRRFHRTSKALG